MFVPGSDGGSIGVIESFNGGASISYDKTVGPTAKAPMLMAGATEDLQSGYNVIVGGLLGAASSNDGLTWTKTPM